MAVRHGIAQLRVVMPSKEGCSPPRLDIVQLMGQESMLILAHGTDEYTLRITRNGKLIFTN